MLRNRVLKSTYAQTIRFTFGKKLKLLECQFSEAARLSELEVKVVTEIQSWARTTDRKDGYVGGFFYPVGICGQNQQFDGGVCEL